MAFGLTRPTEPGEIQVRMSAQAEATTIFVDLVGMTIDNLGVGGFDNPVLSASVQALFECGGKSLLKQRRQRQGRYFASPGLGTWLRIGAVGHRLT